MDYNREIVPSRLPRVYLSYLTVGGLLEGVVSPGLAAPHAVIVTLRHGNIFCSR